MIRFKFTNVNALEAMAKQRGLGIGLDIYLVPILQVYT